MRPVARKQAGQCQRAAPSKRPREPYVQSSVQSSGSTCPRLWLTNVASRPKKPVAQSCRCRCKWFGLEPLALCGLLRPWLLRAGPDTPLEGPRKLFVLGSNAPTRQRRKRKYWSIFLTDTPRQSFLSPNTRPWNITSCELRAAVRGFSFGDWPWILTDAGDSRGLSADLQPFLPFSLFTIP